MEVDKDLKPARASSITWYNIGYDILKNNLTDVKGSDIEDIKADAEAWFISEKVKNAWYGKLLHEYLGGWFAKTLMLIGKVFAERYFYDWINNIDRRDSDEDEDEDDDRD